MNLNPKDPGMVNGFDAIRAVHRAKHLDPTQSAESTPIPESGAKINRTALPTRHEITCYECGFEFHMAGKTETTFCSKCRTKLDISDHVIDGDCTEPLKTAGRIHLTSSGVLKGGVLMGADVRLEGRFERGAVTAFRRLEVGPGILFDSSCMKGRDLWVLADAKVNVKEPVTFRHLNVSGDCRGNFLVSGTVVLNPAGSFEGKLSCRAIEVEEGAFLNADLNVDPLLTDPCAPKHRVRAVPEPAPDILARKPENTGTETGLS